MCKRIISYLIIISLIWMDAAVATHLSLGLSQEAEEKPGTSFIPSLRINSDDSDPLQVSGGSPIPNTNNEANVLDIEDVGQGSSSQLFDFPNKVPPSSALSSSKKVKGSYWVASKKNKENSKLSFGDPTERTPLIVADVTTDKGKKSQPSLESAMEENHRDLRVSLLFEEEIVSETQTATHACLRYIKDVIIDGNSTWRQKLGWAAGICIGVAKSQAWPSIYLDGLVSPINPWHAAFKGTDTLLTKGIISFISITLGLDSMSRNAVILHDLWGPSMDAFSIPQSKWEKWKGAKSGVYGVIAPTSATANMYYFFKVQFHDIQAGVNATGTKFFLGFLTPGVVLDTGLDTGYQMMKFLREREVEARNVFYYNQRKKGESIPKGEETRQRYLHFLKDLRRIIPTLCVSEPTAIHDLNEDVFVSGFGKSATQKGITPQDIEDMKLEDALRVINVLEAFYASQKVNAPPPPEEQEEKRNKITSNTALGITTAATFARSYLFFYTFCGMLTAAGEACGIDTESSYYMSYYIFNLITSGVFGAVIGATLGQAPIEKMSLEECMQDLPGGTSETKATSYKPLRIMEKFFNYGIMAPTIMLPLILTFIEGTPGWGWWRLLPLLPALIADGANTACSFNASSGDLITGLNRVVAYRYQTLSYKIDRLMRLIRRLEGIFEIAREDVVQNIDDLRLKLTPASLDPESREKDDISDCFFDLEEGEDKSE
jgi:hypothetical protein